MARVKYLGMTVVKSIEEGILVSMRIDGMFVVTKNSSGVTTKLGEFYPADILNEQEKSLEKKFKRHIANFTDGRVNITPDVKIYLANMAARLKK